MIGVELEDGRLVEADGKDGQDVKEDNSWAGLIHETKREKHNVAMWVSTKVTGQ